MTNEELDPHAGETTGSGAAVEEPVTAQALPESPAEVATAVQERVADPAVAPSMVPEPSEPAMEPAEPRQPEAACAVAATCGVEPQAEPPAPASASEDAVDASSAEGGCWECGEGEPPPLVYALGELLVDYGTEARRDSFIQQGLTNPDDTVALLEHLDRNPPHLAGGLIWVLAQEGIPLYAIQPGGAFASETYDRLTEILRSQMRKPGDDTLAIVSIPGWKSGEATLMSGHSVPIIWPEYRGIREWKAPDILRVFNALAGKSADGGEDDLFKFLNVIYFQLRNTGESPDERALNYAATEAALEGTVATVGASIPGLGLPGGFLQTAIGDKMLLKSIRVEPSPLCRPGSDCRDVRFTLFKKEDVKLKQPASEKVHHFTVDVSDVLPVKIGVPRTWSTA